jgi:4-hydroxy-4-methyl-2-oxoglutarate aldolase
VVFVAAADIDRVLDAADIVADRERQMVAGLREGLPASQVMGKSYETMLKK